MKKMDIIKKIVAGLMAVLMIGASASTFLYYVLAG